MSMAREMRRLEAIRLVKWKLSAPTREARRKARRAQRDAEALDAETVAERRARLQLHLDIAESKPFWAPQAEMLRVALAELEVGSEFDSMTWAQFRTRSGT